MAFGTTADLRSVQSRGHSIRECIGTGFFGKELQPPAQFPRLELQVDKSTVLNEARVLIISRPSIIDDGIAYVQPHGSTDVRLLPLGGGMAPMKDKDDWHNRAAMNAVLLTREISQPETIDWLALCLAYLSILDDAPNLADEHYSPEPTDKYFKPYTVPGFSRELPALAKKHLSPTLTCRGDDCTVHFYYRTEPVEPLQVADFLFRVEDRKVMLLQAKVQDYAPERGKKQATRLK